MPDQGSSIAVDSGPSWAESCCVTLGVRLHIPESQRINKRAMTKQPQFLANTLSSSGQWVYIS